ncbi:YaaC family protein (plasmid) [Streptomyces sp. NBC_00016]|uniref:YaaC family protein n=1 Tax=Streptomyces sp. NBC_00016 TaxID=2975622 RepID=UPI00324CA815
MHSDLGTDEAWERLRASRSNPPARASTGARRKTYSAALEQLEQMFRAAAVVGPATRPLQVFYGLSQAGRAITAAAWSLKGEDWRLDSHGIKTTGFDRPFPEIEIRTDPAGTQGSFVKVSEVLDSPVWEKTSVRLEDVWDLLPPTRRHPLTSRNRMPALYTDIESVGGHLNSLMSLPVCDIPDRVIEAGTREALADFFATYPALAGHAGYEITGPLGDDGPPDYARYRHGGGELRVMWAMPEGVTDGNELRRHIRAITRSYAGCWYFLPALPRMTRELHPLMAWWAVLYTLSMLARYEPATWGRLISVDNSQHAVPVEQVLERAISHLPVLIADTIIEVSS